MQVKRMPNAQCIKSQRHKSRISVKTVLWDRSTLLSIILLLCGPKFWRLRFASLALHEGFFLVVSPVSNPLTDFTINLKEGKAACHQASHLWSELFSFPIAILGHYPCMLALPNALSLPHLEVHVFFLHFFYHSLSVPLHVCMYIHFKESKPISVVLTWEGKCSSGISLVNKAKWNRMSLWTYLW